MKETERDIQKTCSDLLALDGWRCVRTDPVSDRRRGKGFGEIGMADCLYLRYSVASIPGSPKRYLADVLWIEWKSPKGKPKPHQLEWHKRERAREAHTLIAGIDFPASSEGFLSWYNASGLCDSKLSFRKQPA